jgi:hypothetical protein
MKDILKEIISEFYLITEGKGKDIKPRAKRGSNPVLTKGDGVVPSGLWGSGRYYYKDKGLVQYAGTVDGTGEDRTWVPAAVRPKPASGRKSKNSAPTIKPTATPIGVAPEPASGRKSKPSTPTIQPTATPTKPMRGKTTTAQEAPSKYVNAYDQWLASQVFGSVFSQGSTKLTRGKNKITVRLVQDATGKGIEANTPEGIKKSLQIIDAQLKNLETPIKDACIQLGQNTDNNQRQRIKKFMGNVGELYTLREMLATGTESYLLPDSYPKNDIVTLLQDKKRGLKITEISVKSSTGEKVGAMGANAREPLHATVEDKKIVIGGKEYDATNAIDASILIYSQLLRFATEGYIVGEKREIVVPPDKMKNFDKATIEQSIELSKQGKKKAQDLLLKARKITPKDIEDFKNSSLYGKNMTPEHAELTNYYLNQLLKQVNKNGDYRLEYTKDLFTNQIADIFEKTDSNLVFESDLVAVKFSAANGYEGIKITPAEIMRQRVIDNVGDITQLSKRDQLEKLGGWRLGTRGLNTHHPKTRAPKHGYFGAIFNMAPPTKWLTPTDKLSPKEFINYINSQQTPSSKMK